MFVLDFAGSSVCGITNEVAFRKAEPIYCLTYLLLALKTMTEESKEAWGAGLTHLFIDLWLLCSPLWAQLSTPGTSQSLCCQHALVCAGREQASVCMTAKIQ